MTLIYYVYPADQWCDRREGMNPFVSKVDYDDVGADLAGLRREHQRVWEEKKALEATLRAVNATMREIIKRNQGGYIGDWDAIHHTVEIINKALSPDAEGNSKIGSARTSKGVET